MPKVLNKRTDKIPSDAVYVGRPSKWGNPFRITTRCSRDNAIEQFRQWLHRRYIKDDEMKEALAELKGKDLVCWCSPLPCHADVLLELANLEGK